MMKNAKQYLVGALLTAALSSRGQELPKGLEVGEFYRLSASYSQAPDLSFNVTYTYADSTTPETVEEQLQGSFKIHDGKSWVLLDSVEYVQGGLYNLAVYHRDSMVLVMGRNEETQVLSLPLTDSLFREANVVSMSVTMANDSTRCLRVVFNHNSPYRSYEVRYNPTNYRISTIRYYMTDGSNTPSVDLPTVAGGGTGAPELSGVTCITMTFSGYDENVVSEEYFRDAKFVYRYGNEIKLQPPYAGFRLMLGNELQQ